MPPKRKASAKDGSAYSGDRKRRNARGANRQPVAPPSIDLRTTHPALNDYDAPTVASILRSDNPDQVASALNALLRASSDVDANYCLGPGGERVVRAMVGLFDEAVGWEGGDGDGDAAGDDDGDDDHLEPTVRTWDAGGLVGINRRWREFCRDKLASPLASSSDPSRLIDPDTDARVCEMIVSILRNLSYVAQNLRFLYHSEGALRVLTGALYYRGYAGGGGGGGGGDGSDRPGEHPSSHQSNMCVHAVQTLINMAPLLDPTGRQLFIDRMFIQSTAREVVCTVPDQRQGSAEGSAASEKANERPKYGLSSFLGFGGLHFSKQYDAKAETIENIPNSVVWGLVGSHVRTTLAIFPALSAILDPNDVTTTSTSASGWHRPSVLAVMELLTALLENPVNKGVFLCVPDALLHRLTEMLFMPRLGPDSMDYIDPVSNVVTRVVALKLRMGYDATVDSDLRDRACDLLVKLTDLSTGIKRRAGMAPSVSGMARRRYDDASTPSMEASGGLAPSILRRDEASSRRRINVRLYDGLLSMISSSSGRADAGPLAVRLLSNLALVPENRPGALYVERKLISMAGKDPHIANIACNGIFKSVR